MNRKYNPYLSLVALLLLALVLVFVCTGCCAVASAEETNDAHRYTYEVEKA